MKRSDWIAICSMIVGVLLTTIGSAVHLSYKIGGISEKISSMDKRIDVIEQDIKEMRVDISELRVEMAEIRVKVDELWDYHVNQLKSTKTASKVKLVAF